MPLWLSWPRAIGGLVLAGCLLWIFLVLKGWHDDSVIKLPAARAESQRLGAEVVRLRDLAKLSDDVLEKRDADRQAIDAVAADVRDLGNRVQLCARKSDVRVTVTPEGAIAAVPDGQLRDLADAVRDFAASCAHERDRDAVDHNALIEWLEGVRTQPDGS